jgi:hypothetical protein
METSALLEMFKLAGVDTTTSKASELLEDTKIDHQILLLQDKFNVSRKEAARLYYEDGVRADDKNDQPKVKKQGITA